ncbi:MULTISPECIES: NADP-dependent malic enzyme [Halobacteriovorax]|uniref:NADP-dependent malic enzyme n=1 Tax=Halobacteriovorax TaxID=1652133 RepID=UPI000EB6C880|nr:MULTISPECIES: NADP-dependent malic enzyme [Halobacteriovorax]AYF43392.1 putative phosphate acetyltransferase [Halobacteriovorax sp. BALOs_7]
MSETKTDKAQVDAQKIQKALDYHSMGKPGKIEVIATKPCLTASDLTKAYSPGVAHPCLEIAKNPDDVYKYTAKGNLVAVVSNGSAVLGLGNIGPAAGKPVMEGKGILFKRFADIDVFDIEVDETSVEGMVNVVKSLEPTFGGINLEDIKAPECFEIEKQLIEKMDIPVFHDDQHGTAIIAAAGFINALELSGKKIEDVKVVFSGAGAASMACANIFFALGVKNENLMMTDSRGVIYKGRKDGMNEYKEKYAIDTDARTLGDAMNNADVFIGCSAKGVLTKDMVKTMASNPIIFAMANPDPEILPSEVEEVRDDAIMATGRSDFPNQVNNVLGFPSIFRGALDVRAKKINEEMKLAAVYALANLAKEEVPDEVKLAYQGEDFKYGRNYIIPKPFDTRVLTKLAPAVAKAAMDTGVARTNITDLQEYSEHLASRLSASGAFMKTVRDRLASQIKARDGKKIKMVFAEGVNTRILHVAKTLAEGDAIQPILLGHPDDIRAKIKSLNLDDVLDDSIEIIRPRKAPNFKEFYTEYCEMKQREGVSLNAAEDLMIQENYYGSMMVKKGLADTFIAGPSLNYSDCLKPALSVIGAQPGKKAAGVFILVFKDRVLFLADTTVQPDPSAEDLVEIAKSTQHLYKSLMRREPRIAFLSYSNFGDSKLPDARKMKNATKMAKEKYPELIIEGEMQADVAVNENIMNHLFDFSKLGGSADILIFPELNSANISYKLLAQLSEASAIGPILAPMNQTVNIIQRTASIKEIVDSCRLTALRALEEPKH